MKRSTKNGNALRKRRGVVVAKELGWANTEMDSEAHIRKYDPWVTDLLVTNDF
jgi:hypothetical protein